MMIFKVVLFLAVFTVGLIADIKEVSVVAEGMSKQEAISNALVEAISRIKGVEVASKTKSSFSNEEFSSSKNGVENKGSFSENSFKKDINSITKGVVKTYEVIDAQRVGDRWEVELLVSIPVYKEVGISTKNRRKIAVMPFHTLDKRYIMGKYTYKGKEVADILTQALVTNMTQARKFAVLDRSYVSDMAKEMNLLNSSEVNLSQKVKLGQKLGADYIIVGTIKNASIYEKNSYNRSLGTKNQSNMVELIVDYRVIVVGTSQIKWSDTQKVTLQSSNTNQSFRMLMQNSMEKLASKITTSLLQNIYPIRVLKVTNSGMIVLNQGGNSVKKGMRLDVMHAGKKMYDPYTKELLGNIEEKVAEIEVIRVTPKLSYAKVVDGTLDLVGVKDICRFKKDDSLKNSTSLKDNKDWRGAGDVKINKGGGVHLPFD